MRVVQGNAFLKSWPRGAYSPPLYTARLGGGGPRTGRVVAGMPIVQLFNSYLPWAFDPPEPADGTATQPELPYRPVEVLFRMMGLVLRTSMNRSLMTELFKVCPLDPSLQRTNKVHGSTTAKTPNSAVPVMVSGQWSVFPPPPRCPSLFALGGFTEVLASVARKDLKRSGAVQMCVPPRASTRKPMERQLFMRPPF